MLKVMGLTPGINSPSSRFRIRQYIPELLKHDIQVEEFCSPISYNVKLPGILGKVKQRYVFPLSGSVLAARILSRIPQLLKSQKYDAVWLNRAFLGEINIEKKLKHPLIFDIDDAVWLKEKEKYKYIAENSTAIFAGNSYIADWFGQYNKQVHIIPTTIDIEKFKPIKHKTNDPFRVVWTGTHQTEQYLFQIENALNIFFKKHDEAKLIIVSNRFPKFRFLPPEKIIFHKWTPEAEVRVIQNAHAGIMPLFNGEWEKGKCSLKMLQYMAVGLPVVVSPVGMNLEVLAKGKIGFAASNESEWIDALENILTDRNKSEELGRTGRRIVETNYNMYSEAGKISTLLKTLR